MTLRAAPSPIRCYPLARWPGRRPVTRVDPGGTHQAHGQASPRHIATRSASALPADRRTRPAGGPAPRAGRRRDPGRGRHDPVAVAVAATSPRTRSREASGTFSASAAQEYAYVRSDLRRIVKVAAGLFGTMFVLFILIDVVGVIKV